MEHFLNNGMGKASLILAILLSIIYALRVVNKKYFNNENKVMSILNRALRKYHKIMGIIIIFTGLIHGIFSGEPVLSFNLGTFTWIISIILGLNFMFKNKLYKFKPWIYYHRLLTLVFLILMFLHIQTVK